MAEDDGSGAPADNVQSLLRLAQDRSEASRRELFDNVVELFIADDHRLSERERTLMAGILDRLVSEVEVAVRGELAERLAKMPDAPAELLEVVANDRVEVARPVLLVTRLLEDAQLIEVVRQRGREHALVVATRETVSEDVSDVLVENGDPDVIETLLNNAGAELSRAAMTYLVAEAERFDRFQEPLLRRHDLPADLAMNLYWLVSAAWRRYIVETFAVEQTELDSALEAATAAASHSKSSTVGEASAELASSLSGENRLTPGLVLTLLRQGRVPAAVAGLANLGGITQPLTRHVLIDAGGESLAILARAVGFDRREFANFVLVARRFRGAGATDPAVLNEVLAFFDRVGETRARAVVAHWQRNGDYVRAIERLDSAVDARRQRVRDFARTVE